MVGFGGISTGSEDTGRRWRGRKRVKGVRIAEEWHIWNANDTSISTTVNLIV